MPERKKIKENNPKKPAEALIATTDKSYPIDMVKEAYIKSDQGLKGFARRYGLNEKELQQLIDSGDWEAAKERYKERVYRTIIKDRIEIVEWRQSLLQRAELFELMAVEGVLNDMGDQMQKDGDLFVRNSLGEITRDEMGNPKIRRITKEMKESLKLSQDLREANAKIIREEVGLQVITLDENEVKQLYNQDELFVEGDGDE